jgi:hypothetical protein
VTPVSRSILPQSVQASAAEILIVREYTSIPELAAHARRLPGRRLTFRQMGRTA